MLMKNNMIHWIIEIMRKQNGVYLFINFSWNNFICSFATKEVFIVSSRIKVEIDLIDKSIFGNILMTLWSDIVQSQVVTSAF